MEGQNQTDKNKSLTEHDSQSGLVLNEQEPITYFKKDKSFVFAHQKIEKLIAAVYMITNFLPNEEPIKWTLRGLCMKVIHLNIDLKNTNKVNQADKERELRELSLEIVSLLEVGMFAGLISSMNLSILKKEFYGLLDHLEKTLNRSTLSKSFLGGSYIADNVLGDGGYRSQKNEPKPSQNIPTKKTFKDSFARESARRDFKDKNIVTDNEFYNDDIGQNDSALALSQKAPKLKEFGPVAVKKNKRQSIIIGLLKKKKEIMVKDVSEIVIDCSEKTIQRELQELVAEGVLTKTGERRWTRYYLAAKD
jgi:DeoR-like helix-turn-helix domain